MIKLYINIEDMNFTVPSNQELYALEEKLGYHFKNINLLIQALCHPSIKGSAKAKQLPLSYERLEFLGDSIVNFAISEALYLMFPDDAEGKLSKLRMTLVCGETMYHIAQHLEISQFIILDNGESLHGGRHNPKNLENVMEALMGAIYLDSQDYNTTKAIILSLWQDLLHQDFITEHDPKTTLQEITQNRFKLCPVYTVIEKDGPPHDLTFTVEVNLPNLYACRGIAKSRKAAEKRAALAMLKQIGISNEK
jgi:ribonuclease-3